MTMPKSLTVFLVVVALILAGLFFGLYSYQTFPSYLVALLKKIGGLFSV